MTKFEELKDILENDTNITCEEFFAKYTQHRPGKPGSKLSREEFVEIEKLFESKCGSDPKAKLN